MKKRPGSRTSPVLEVGVKLSFSPEMWIISFYDHELRRIKRQRDSKRNKNTSQFCSRPAINTISRGKCWSRDFKQIIDGVAGRFMNNVNDPPDLPCCLF